MNNFVTRSYNSLKLDGDKLIKTCSTDRTKKETEWFQFSQQYIPQNLPTIYKVNLNQQQKKTKKSSFSMDFIEADNIFQWINRQTDEELVTQIFTQLIKFLRNEVHILSQPAKTTDIEHMYLEKPTEALKFFSQYSGGLSKRYIINDQNCQNPLVVLKKLYQYFEPELKNIDYTLMHGDSTFSNILIDQKHQFYLIDPRGKFGQTQFFGDPRYDYAKIYYSISGNFDSLNVGRFDVEELGQNLFTYQISPLPFNQSLSRIFFEEVETKTSIIQYIHASIWLSLVPHLKVNHDQMLTAFLHGTKLINQLKNKINFPAAS